MTYQRQVSRTLDDEHRVNLELLGRIEQAFARAPRSGNAGNAELIQLAGVLVRHIEQDVGRHFDFEEQELFPRMSDAGDGDMASLMTEEHDAIRAVASEVLPLARAAGAGTLDDAGWTTLKRGALEMVVEHGRELDVRGGLAQRGGEPPLEIGPAHPPFRDRVDVDDRIEIGAREPAQRGVPNRNGFHPCSS